MSIIKIDFTVGFVNDITLFSIQKQSINFVKLRKHTRSIISNNKEMIQSTGLTESSEVIMEEDDYELDFYDTTYIISICLNILNEYIKLNIDKNHVNVRITRKPSINAHFIGLRGSNKSKSDLLVSSKELKPVILIKSIKNMYNLLEELDKNDH